MRFDYIRSDGKTITQDTRDSEARMDRIVAATQFRDMVLVFTERGEVFKVRWDEMTSKIVFERHAVLPIR